jgi:hypothetical protein
VFIPRLLREKLWTDRISTPVLLTAKQRSELHAAQLFTPSAHVPVRSYGVQDTQHALNTESLWETCTSSIAGMFVSMPLTDEAVNKERNKHAHESTVHVPRSVFEQFDPSLDYAEDRMHSMEILMDKLLLRARALTPHFWTHTHRYVPSDSVWCESHGQAVQEPATTTTPATFREHKLWQEQVLTPSADQFLYPADVLSSCVCGWSTTCAYARTQCCSRVRSAQESCSGCCVVKHTHGTCPGQQMIWKWCSVCWYSLTWRARTAVCAGLP